jgi:3-methyladenine DNA glycosylase AlkD
MSQELENIKLLLQKFATEKHTLFYKVNVGDYAEHDQFIVVSVPILRKIAKGFIKLPLENIKNLIESPINEERLLALLILINQYERGDKTEIYRFYVCNLKYVNNWNLVDSSAHLIAGAHLYNKGKEVLVSLAKSEILWERRISIVSALHFIRNGEFEWTLRIAKILLQDTHDLIHKAVGWMLREVGKRNKGVLVVFLDQYAACMPRTMLRYAIEKLPQNERKSYLNAR